MADQHSLSDENQLPRRLMSKKIKRRDFMITSAAAGLTIAAMETKVNDATRG
jgi:hypothetical protein